MADKKYLDENGLVRFLANIINTFAKKTDLTSGDTVVAEATHASSADTATSATTATNATHATTADSATTATTATSATSATKDASGNVITSTYETKSDASAKLASAKAYTDEQIDALDYAASSHSHAISDVTNLQSELDSLESAISGKAASSHSHTITANASDDDVVVLTGTNGSNAVTYSASHANSGVTAGTYKSVTVNAKGHVTGGSNPTTLSGYGITDAYTKSQVDSSLSGKAAASHSHDDLYYTEDEIDTKVATLESSIAGKAASSHSHSDATTSASGFMSASDKTKLNNIASGAEVNQNAFANVVVGDTTIAADAKSDSLTIAAGTGISVAGDATNDKVTITNSGVRSISTGSSNGTISVNTNGTSANVAVKGLGSAAYTASTAYDAAGTAASKADAALASAKEYADGIKDDLLNGAGTAYDTLKELGDLIDTNVDAIDALETVAASKADASALTSHTSNTSNPHNVTLAQLGVTATAAELNIMDGVTATAAEINKLDGVTATTAEINYLDGVTSAIQSQLDSKAAASHTHDYAASSHSHTITASASDDDVVVLAGTNGTNKVTYTASHATSGVTAGTYKSVTVNKYGHVTGGTNPTTLAGYGITDAAAKSHTHSDYVNQNAFSNVVVGDTTIAADSTTDTLTMIAGSNVTLTPNATNGSVTIAATDTVYTHPSYTARTGVPTANQTPAFGGTFSVTQPVSDASGHITAMNSRTVTIPSTAATTSAAGLMSAADKTKLDGIATSANNYSLPAATSSALGGVKIGSNITNSSGTISLTKDNVVAALGYTPPTSDTNTDTKVTQTVTSSNAVYPLLLAPNAQTATTTTTTYFDSGVTLNPSTNTIAANVSGSSASCTGNAATATSATTASKLGSSTLGSTTQPVYLSSGTATKCSTYAGGTAVTLNNSSKAASTASFYAPTAGGTSGYVLTGAGTTSAPTWTAQSSLSVGSATSATTAGTCTGNSATATKLATARTISLTGDAAGSASFDGSGDASISTSVTSMHGVTTAGDGAAYTATVSGITALTAGVSFIMVPHTNSTTTTPTLNVNSLGAKGLRMRGSTATGTAMTSAITAWLASGRPVQVTYNGIYWLAEVTRPSASDLSGTVAIANGGTGATTAAAALTSLGAAASDVITVSSTEPTSSTCMLWVQI